MSERPEIELVYDPSIAEEYRREQERKKPKPPEWEGGGSGWWLVCPECHSLIETENTICKCCGQIIGEQNEK